MKDEIEKILEEYDARYAHLSTASRVAHLYGSHGKMIADMRQWIGTKLVQVYKKKKTGA